jgi:hypothetical protein
MSELARILKYIEERNINVKKYSEKLRDALSTLNSVLWRMDITQEFRDDVPFRTVQDGPDEKKYYLVLRRSQLEVEIYRSDEDDEEDEELVTVVGPADATDKTMVALYRSGRLVEFLRKVASELEKKEKEYQQLLKIAEAIEGAVASLKATQVGE